VYLNDPASGRRQVTVEEFDRSFTGVALTFCPTEDFVRAGVRPRLLPSLLERLRGARGAVLFLVLAGLGLVLTGLAVPVFSQVFVDNVLVDGRTDWLTALLIGMAGTAVLRAVLTWLKLRYLVRLHMRLAVGMSSSFLWHVLRLPIAFFSARSPGDLASRVELNEGVAGLLSGSLAEVVLDLVLVVFYLALIAVYDLPMAAVAVVTALIYGILLVIQERSRVDDSLRMSTERGRMQGIATGGLAMIETLKATGSETAFFSRWAGHQAKLADSQQRATRRDQLFAAFTDGFARVNALVVLGLGALRVMDGQLSLGGLVALQSLMASFLGPIAGLTSFGMRLQSLRGSVERMDDVLGHAPDDHGHSGRPHRRLSGALAVQGVTFGYSPLSPPLIDGVDLTIEPGQRVALIGSSGSGKSTMARLVCGLIRPWSGQILLDEQPYHSWPRSTLAASLAVVDQDITLFEGSVRDNLTLWDPSIPDADLYRAAKDACIHEDILRLPGGYDAQVGEGGFNFSGGQRQRLEIARALVGQPALLVLDEATSALDPETEHQVNQNLRRRGVSCLIVAHRLSTIRDCDEILVLDQGRVVERGTHAQLLDTGARYRQLVAAS
jgi:NHLM bacteriocin system ABC transporter peptidase/ATP-binding protein